jgi:hypothetical protein
MSRAKVGMALGAALLAVLVPAILRARRQQAGHELEVDIGRFEGEGGLVPDPA